MTPPKLSRRAVAAEFLRRQWLDRPRGRRLTERTLPEFVSSVCGLQIDSVNVLDRAHHLTLWSRFGEYDRAKLERLTYRKRVLFEYLTHVACFVATRDLPLHKAIMDDTPARFDYRHRGWRTKRREVIEAVERAIAERGPLGNADFERPKHMGKSAGWWSWKPATHALDFLWKAGRIGVHSRVNFHKRYASMSRVLPAHADTPALPLERAMRERLLRSLAAMGAASGDDLARYWTWPQWKAPAQRATLKALVGEGLVSEVTVEGDGRPWYARTEDVPGLERAHRRRAPSNGTTLLCPFDSFLWHRERVHRLWGYFYRIEIYVPGHKREHGYYSLPLLHDGQLIGRVDLKTHREADVLEARHAHFEPWFAAGKPAPGVRWSDLDRDAALAGLAGALHSLARHVGVAGVKLERVTPGRFKVPLRRTLMG
ncbi:MAG TPA: crosslink repair DNA glycosylase YcaQ family protein [Candidatus Eisenbacteria bacterium]